MNTKILIKIINTSNTFKEEMKIRDASSYMIWLYIFLRGKSAFFGKQVMVISRRTLPDKMSWVLQVGLLLKVFPESFIEPDAKGCSPVTKSADSQFLYSKILLFKCFPYSSLCLTSQSSKYFLPSEFSHINLKAMGGQQGNLERLFIFWAQKILSHQGQQLLQDLCSSETNLNLWLCTRKRGETKIYQ